jgi:purine-binding chemotaxis protein CheW
MNQVANLVVFRLEARRYALALPNVERVVRAVEVTALPNAPAVVMGIFNLAGRLIPVLNIRKRFQLPEREIEPADHFLIAHTTRRTVALVVDEAEQVIERPEAEIVGVDPIVPGLDHVRGIVKLEEGLVLIHDLDTFLSLEETQVLDDAMNRETDDGG